MKHRILLFTLTIMAVSNAIAQAPNYDKSLEHQFMAMELGKIDFTPKEYYRIMHGDPDVLNLWLGDRYAVYDWTWEWAGLHSGFEWKFNANESKARNVNPKRDEVLALEVLADKEFETMMDTIKNEFVRQLALAADCEIDKYYNAYEPMFDKFDDSLTNLISRYFVASGNGDGTIGDFLNIRDDVLNELSSIRQARSNAHDAYMESTQKDEVYRSVLQRYKDLHKKMVWRVWFLEKNKRS